MLKVTKSKNLQHIWTKKGQHYYADCGVIKMGGGKKSRKKQKCSICFSEKQRKLFQVSVNLKVLLQALEFLYSVTGKKLHEG